MTLNAYGLAVNITRINAKSIVLGLLAVGCVVAASQIAVDKLTKEVTTYKGTKAVIVDGGIWDAVMHRDGVLLPGVARISNGAKTIEVVDGYRRAGIGLVTSMKAKDGVDVSPDFEFDYEVLDPKLLVDKYSRSWKFDHLWVVIQSCIAELIMEHDSDYFKNPVDKKAIGLELETKVKLALEREGMPISVSSTVLFTGPYGGRLRATTKGKFERLSLQRRQLGW